MLRLLLIRHGETKGNQSARYIGTTDEPLCLRGREVLEGISLEMPQRVYVSPLKRCIQTAEILFPGASLHQIEELAECDFGEFENKNYKELADNPNYQKWIDSNAAIPFPGGESREAFQQRTLTGFCKITEECIRDDLTYAALVVHGGTIMNIMEEYAAEKRSFYDWHVKNGKGYEVLLDPAQWKNEHGQLLVKREV